MAKKTPTTAAEFGAEGGRARAEKLTADERSAISSRAARVRWSAAGRLKVNLRATHEGPLTIAGSVLPSAVLSDGTRVLSQRAFSAALGAPQGGHAFAKRASDGVAGLPIFVAVERLKPFITIDLAASLAETVEYVPIHGGRSAFGIKAQLVPAVCDIWLKARDAGALTKHQLRIAQKADLLMRGLAHVGIIALVDEATGYQADRAREELQTILEAYIAKELLPWTKRFPDEFFKQIFRLHGWPYKPGSLRGPRYVGKLINKLIYEPLPPGVLDELKRRNPPNDKGYRRHKHHQLLTEDIGNPHLDKQVIEVTALARVSDEKRGFFRLFDKAFPKRGSQMLLELEMEEP